MSEVTETLAMEQTSTEDNGDHAADPLYSWSQLGEQVRRLSGAPESGSLVNERLAPTPQELKRVARHERWATAEPDGSVSRAVSSILSNVFARIDHRSTMSSSDNARHIDWMCPGEIEVNQQRLSCSANLPISNLLLKTPLTSCAFRSPYELARVLSVLTQSHVPEHFRLARMLDHSYDIITCSSLGLALAFFRSHCIHVTIASVEDAGTITLGHPPRTLADLHNLPRMHDDAVKYANEHPWTPTSWKLVQPRRTLLLLPEGFDNVRMGFESATMTAKVVKNPEELEPEWFIEEWSAVVVFTHAKHVEAARWKGAWFLLMQAVAKGAELILLPGPQDDIDWGKSIDNLRDLAEETVAQRPSLAQRIRCLLPMRSQQAMVDAPFKILADKINLVTGRHFTQSAVKRFWTANLRHHNAVLKLPEFCRVTEYKRGVVAKFTEHKRGGVTKYRGYEELHRRSPLRQRQPSEWNINRGRSRGSGVQKRRSVSGPRSSDLYVRPEFPRNSWRGKTGNRRQHF